MGLLHVRYDVMTTARRVEACKLVIAGVIWFVVILVGLKLVVWAMTEGRYDY